MQLIGTGVMFPPQVEVIGRLLERDIMYVPIILNHIKCLPVFLIIYVNANCRPLLILKLKAMMYIQHYSWAILLARVWPGNYYGQPLEDRSPYHIQAGSIGLVSSHPFATVET